MRFFLVIAALCCLAACQDEVVTQPSHENEPVVMVMWEKADTPPRILQAAKVRQEVLDGATLTHCDTVMLRVPLGDGEMVITSPKAVINEGNGFITFDPPIHLAGTVEGRALQGRALAGVFKSKEMALEMVDVRWVHNGQFVDVTKMVLKDDWRSRVAEQPSGKPAPTALNAAQSALPYPMELPKFRRETSQTNE